MVRVLAAILVLCAAQESAPLVQAIAPAVPQRSRLAEVDLPTVTITMTRENHCGFGFSDPTELSQCPDYSVTVRGDGTVEYKGVHGVRTIGTSSYRISLNDVRALLGEFDRAGFYELDDVYRSFMCHGVGHVRDHVPHTTTTLAAGGRTKRVLHEFGAPDSLLRLEAQIDELSGARKLTGREATPTTSRGSITGTIRTESGQPLAGVQVRVRMPTGGGWSSSVTTDRDGKYRIDDVCPVFFQIDVQRDGYTADTQYAYLYYATKGVVDFVMRRAGQPGR